MIGSMEVLMMAVLMVSATLRAASARLQRLLPLLQGGGVADQAR
jgi:hypothetical protein